MSALVRSDSWIARSITACRRVAAVEDVVCSAPGQADHAHLAQIAAAVVDVRADPLSDERLGKGRADAEKPAVEIGRVVRHHLKHQPLLASPLVDQLHLDPCTQCDPGWLIHARCPRRYWSADQENRRLQP